MARRKSTPAATPVDDVTTDKPTAQPDRGPATANAQPPVRVQVDVDTLVTRPELGPAARTLRRRRRPDPVRPRELRQDSRMMHA